MAAVTGEKSLTGRRQDIVAAADELFNAHGINSISVEDIALYAGIPLDGLLDEFPEKRALIEIVLERRHTVWTGNVVSATQTVEDPRDKLLAIFDYLETWFAEESFQGCVFVNAYAEIGRDNPWMATMAIRHKTNFGSIVGRISRDAGLPEIAGTGIALLAEGAQVTAALTRTVAPAREGRATAALLIALYQGAPVASSF